MRRRVELLQCVIKFEQALRSGPSAGQFFKKHLESRRQVSTDKFYICLNIKSFSS